MAKRGRPSLGETRKISLTLPAEIWSYIENDYDDMSQSAAIRDMLEYYFLVTQINKAGDRNQVDIFTAIKKAQAEGKEKNETIS